MENLKYIQITEISVPVDVNEIHTINNFNRNKTVIKISYITSNRIK